MADLARESGVSADTIVAIEAGTSKGSPKTAKKLAEALNVQVMDICGDDGGEGGGVVPLGAVGRGAVGEANITDTKGDGNDRPTSAVG